MAKRKKQKSNNHKRPEKFKDFPDCLHWIKKSVYMIVRGRKTLIDGKDEINWITLGTGFVVAPFRLITAGHVMNDPTKGELFIHQDGDLYYLIKHDDSGAWHYRILELKLNKEIFIYSDIDLGIIYLDKLFYKIGDNVYANEDDFIRVSKDYYSIGSSIGILGYPLCSLQFEDKDINKPKIGDVLLRTDKGVINCRYKTAENIANYEFTLSFNPGNSGGPIFDIKTGRLISIVRGFRSTRININETIFERINTLVERSFNIKVNAKVERKISFHFVRNKFVQRIVI